MKRRHLRFFTALILVFFVFGAFGCAGNQPMTKEDVHKVALMSYDKALQWYTKSARTYEIHYQAAPAHVQADWKERIDPIFLDAKTALDAWWKILSAGDPGAAQEQEWDEWVTKLALTGLDFLEGYSK